MSMTSPVPDPIPQTVTPLTRRAALGACAALLLLFGFLSYYAASTKSATFDETLHAPAAYTHLRYFDFRANPEHPPLWKYWAALPWLVSPPATANVDTPKFAAICEDLIEQWPWAQLTMYRTPGNDPVRLLGMSRFMMMLLGVGCGALIAWWAYRLAGPVAAVVACGLYSLDPNILAHASLVTNDVAYCLAAVGLSYALWKLGLRLTIGRSVAVGVLCGVCVTIKYTGVLAVPIIGLTLLARALMPEAWPAFKLTLDTRWKRLAAAASLCLLTAVLTYAWIWAVYGFRARTAPDPAVHPNPDQLVANAAVREIMGRVGRPATAAELQASRPSVFTETAMSLLQHHFLPDAFVTGVYWAYSESQFRYAYLLGDVYGTGKWYYFPIAVVVKTPLATLIGVGAAVVALVAWGRVRTWSRDRWMLICLGVAPLVFGYATIRSHMNIGVRHFFPVCVYLFLVGGVVAGRLYARYPKVLRPALAVLALGLAAESFAAFPNYIPFFNVAAGGYRGGIHILGDSNLDWGQDLPLVAAWQQDHPDRTLHLAYFGTADPAFYGIRADLLLKDNGLELPDRPLPTSGVIAVSATTLQGIWVPQGRANPFAPLLKMQPAAILGGSIYVYDLGGQ